MTLIPCPECGHEISDKSLSCPQCGFPTSSLSDRMQEVDPKTPESMASDNSELGPSLANSTKTKGEERHHATVILPYAIFNIVFLQKFFLWLLVLISIFLAAVTPSISEGDSPYTSTAATGGAFAVAAVVTILLFALKPLWREALCGRKVAAVAVFALYLPAMLLGAYYLLFAVSAVLFATFSQSHDVTARFSLIIVGIISAVIGVLLLVNVFEPCLWKYISLNNYCPSCRKHRFGYISGPDTRVCDNCGTVINIVRKI
jgi:zinc-ribbon domain